MGKLSYRSEPVSRRAISFALGWERNAEKNGSPQSPVPQELIRAHPTLNPKPLFDIPEVHHASA